MLQYHDIHSVAAQNNVKLDFTLPVNPTCEGAEVRRLSHFEDHVLHNAELDLVLSR